MENSAYYQHARPEIVDLVPRSAKEVLDVGCAAGALGRALKQRQGCRVSGIEMSEEAAAIAREHLDQVFCGDAFEHLATLPENHFDAIIMADVIEHVSDTQRVLSLAKAVLSDAGRIIISIPNVRHWTVVKMLLEGEWRYEEQGILDRTHLRFFTHRSFVRELMLAGLAVETAQATSFQNLNPPPGVAGIISGLGIDINDLEADLTRYQYLFVCRK